MLAIIETYFSSIRKVSSDADIVTLMAAIARDFGFRGAFLYEYAVPGGQSWRVLDTDPGHRDWWREYFTSDFVTDNPRLASLLAGPPFLVFDAARFGPSEQRARDVAERGDVLESTLIPLGYNNKIVGALGFRGSSPLTQQQEMSLLMIAYALFARFREVRNTPLPSDGAQLTPRERQVIRLSADGLTSMQIATKLGMSTRTANQHFDNIADKLGTRNRAHTVAEVIRRGLLD